MNIKKENFRPKKIYEVFYDTLKNSNYEVFKCYNLVFNKTILTKNKGSMIVMIFFFFHLVCLFIYIIKGIKPLANALINKIEYINSHEKISNQFIESEMIEINKKSRNSIFKKKLKLKNPPPKNKKIGEPTYIYKKKNDDYYEQIIKNLKKPLYSDLMGGQNNNKIFSQKLKTKLDLYPKNMKYNNANNKISSSTKLKNNKSISYKNKKKKKK